MMNQTKALTRTDFRKIFWDDSTFKTRNYKRYKNYRGKLYKIRDLVKCRNSIGLRWKSSLWLTEKNIQKYQSEENVNAI